MLLAQLILSTMFVAADPTAGFALDAPIIAEPLPFAIFTTDPALPPAGLSLVSSIPHSANPPPARPGYTFVAVIVVNGDAYWLYENAQGQTYTIPVTR